MALDSTDPLPVPMVRADDTLHKSNLVMADGVLVSRLRHLVSLYNTTTHQLLVELVPSNAPISENPKTVTHGVGNLTNSHRPNIIFIRLQLGVFRGEGDDLGLHFGVDVVTSVAGE